MVYLGGPRGRGSRGRGLYLHDPPPGYRPPRRHLGLKAQQRMLRRDAILMRVTTLILVLAGSAVLVIIALMITMHG